MKGKRFGNLLVLGKSENKKYHYKCLCDCGNVLDVSKYKLRDKQIKSCGCTKGIKHGKYHTRLYHIYYKMKTRCYNKHHISYKDYGGRGIKICNEWLNDFMKFYNWAIANGYNDNLTIDRIDVNGNYEPSNCRWADRTTQSNNTRRCIYITYNGKTQTIAQWAEELGINYNTLRARKTRLKWSDVECLLGKEVNNGI